MNISEATSKKLIILNQDLSTKQEIFMEVAKKFKQVGIIKALQTL